MLSVAAGNPNGIKILLVNGLSTLFIKGQPFLSNDARSLSRNPPNCTILDSWAFENIILADDPFAKALQILETCVLVNCNLCGKSVLSLESPTTFDYHFPDFNLLSCELKKLHLKYYIESLYTDKHNNEKHCGISF